MVPIAAVRLEHTVIGHQRLVLRGVDIRGEGNCNIKERVGLFLEGVRTAHIDQSAISWGQGSRSSNLPRLPGVPSSPLFSFRYHDVATSPPPSSPGRENGFFFLRWRTRTVERTDRYSIYSLHHRQYRIKERGLLAQAARLCTLVTQLRSLT